MSSLYLIRNAWADVTDISAATRYYPTMAEDVGALLGQATELRLAFDCSGGVTLTVEYVGQVLGDAVPASADWVDITSQGHPIGGGAGAVSYVDTKNTLVFVLPPGRVRVKIVTSDATNAVQLIATLQPIDAANINAAITASALPAGAATEATLGTVHGHVDSIDGKTPALGTALMAASSPVTIATNDTVLTGIDTKLGGTAIVNVRSAVGTWTPATAAAAGNTGVISAAACKGGRVLAVNSHATITYYLQLFDLAAVPADATAPRLPSIPLVPGQAVMLDLGGMTLANGLCWAASTTIATKTAAATNPFQVSAEVL